MACEHLDVIIIGAGLSGVGAACHLAKMSPSKSFALLEARQSLGGTWDLFRYPGIRSDSDMFTLGYSFKPWEKSKHLADGDAVLNYINEAAKENNIDKKIRYGVAVKSVDWNSTNSNWTINYEEKEAGSQHSITCNYIISCTGYYNYKKGYEPKFVDSDKFKGDIIHPQKWPKDYDYKDKRVVVIGSGATAVTLVPAMSKSAKHVTMLQRSPTYMVSIPKKDKGVEAARKYFPEKIAYRLIRTRNVSLSYLAYFLARKFPKQTRKLLLSHVEQQVGSEELKHFNPNYNPWDERICATRSGDIFDAMRKGDASIVTDHIDRFTENGILLKSGDLIEADVIITATGLDMQFFGGIEIYKDGERFDPTEKMIYKGVMVEGLPNIGFTFGYTNASWTLKADLSSQFLCRVINHMDQEGYKQTTPINRDRSLTKVDMVELNSGYIQRGISKFPFNGSKYPWKIYQSYPLDLLMFRYGKLEDGLLTFSGSH